MIRKTLTIFSLLCLLLVYPTAGCGVLDQLINAECRVDADCDDGLFCTGVETCDAGECQDGTPPCPNPRGPECGTLCSEEFDGCGVPAFCTSDRDCDDSLFCNGAETCNEVCGFCLAGEPPCEPGESCEEGTDTCVPPAA